MTDPVTIGALASLVLGMASEAALKGVVGAAAKDAYNALKEQIAHWAAGDVEALDKNPTSASRRAVIAETVDELPEAEQLLVKALATQLADALKESAANGPIGIDVGVLEAARIKLDEINVRQGVGIRVQTVKTPGDFEVKRLTVGDVRGKAGQ